MQAVAGGVELFDTADVYCHDDHDLGASESLLAGVHAAWSPGRAHATRWRVGPGTGAGAISPPPRV
jgi:hypothetical protein